MKIIRNLFLLGNLANYNYYFFKFTGTHMENALFHYCAILWFGTIMGGQIMESDCSSIPICRPSDGTIKNDSSIFTLDF